MWHGRAHTWEKIKWTKELWKEISGGNPSCVKGIQAVDDAKKVVDIGCGGIVVSSHAGRQVDGAVASLDALEKIVDGILHFHLSLQGLLIWAFTYDELAVGDKTHIMFDYGVRIA